LYWPDSPTRTDLPQVINSDPKLDEAKSMAVRKVLIPAAGLGTRFLPATKSTPKEMLPLVDTPAIQFVVEEAVRAGLDDVLVITGRTKRSIEDHFDRSVELEVALEQGGKTADFATVREIADMAQVHFVRQPFAGGLGHAISFGRQHMNGEPFAVMLPDDIMVDESALLKRMIEAHNIHKCSVVALKRFPAPQISLYGCAGIDGYTSDGFAKISTLIEKPAAADAPSDLAIMGRYLFTPAIFDKIAITPPGRGGEIQITDAMSLLLADEPILGVVFEDGRYDIGNKLDFLRATVELAIARDDLGADFRSYLKDLVESW
jgi:UTP--glucose-1-phosphate uridylyltransferase